MFLIKIGFVFWVSWAYFWREKGNQEIESNVTFTLDTRNYSSGVLTLLTLEVFLRNVELLRDLE